MGISAGNYSGFDFRDDEDETPFRSRRSHPRPGALEGNRTPQEVQFAELVKHLRIKQNEAIIDWLRDSRQELGRY